MSRAVSAAIIEEDKLLLVRKQNTWILPGGKLEPGELDLEALTREVAEELSGTKIGDVRFYGDFSGLTPHSKRPIDVSVYLASLAGPLGMPSAEIAEAAWYPGQECTLSEITGLVVDALTKDGYIR